MRPSQVTPPDALSPLPVRSHHSYTTHSRSASRHNPTLPADRQQLPIYPVGGSADTADLCPCLTADWGPSHHPRTQTAV